MGKRESLTVPSYQTLAKLASDDPQAFEALRSELIENCITQAPERIQLRLRQIQFRLDGIRRLSRSPLGALLKIQALMWDSFLLMDRELQRFVRPSKNGSHYSDDEMCLNSCCGQSAQIIEFRPRALPTANNAAPSKFLESISNS